MITASQIQSLFLDLLNQLSEKESHVIIHRTGLQGQRQTLQEIGDAYGITRERVRQIEVRAFEKLQKAVRNAAIDKKLATGEG